MPGDAGVRDNPQPAAAAHRGLPQLPIFHVQPPFPMTLTAFLQRLRAKPEQIEFADTISVIDAHYRYTPAAFRNGEVVNAAGQNAGSCKIFAFAKLHGLNAAETLACFGRYYRDDVLQHPDASDHQNIRNFMRSGWPGVAFENEALSGL
ncbi:MAG: HopJ type III effector protein [Nevskia sp.]|nr:HopJ type III effector protein [Nevskia sp.]